MASFTHQGHRLAYTEHDGGGPTTIVLVHGLLFSQKLMRPMADDLSLRGHRVVTLDVLGHGRSDRPDDPTAYSMEAFGAQIIGLLDHLGVAQAVVGGLSLGANASLEAAALAPDRILALVVEMPVLDNALLAAAAAFTPLMLGLTVGAPLLRPLSRVLRTVPTPPAGRAGWFADVMLDLGRQDPGPGAALLKGLFAARKCPPKAVRETLAMPALVVGHRRDPIHPFSDAGALAAEMPHARLLEVSTILEGRLTPARLNGEVAAFLADVLPPVLRSAS